MLECPLPTLDKEDLHQGCRSLLPKCQATCCTYWQGNLNSKYLPGGCILLIVALLDKERMEEQDA